MTITGTTILEQLRPIQNVQAVRELLDQAPWAVRRVVGALNSDREPAWRS